jgi:hypothetical protein
MPTLSTARERGKAGDCLSNIKQLGIANTLYSDFNDGFFIYGANWATYEFWCGKGTNGFTNIQPVGGLNKYMGNNAKFIVTGDATQIDLPNKGDSGLAKGVAMLKGTKGISVVNFSKEDIVRHPLVSKIVKIFEGEEC